MANLLKQYSTPTSGTITALDTQQDIHIIHNGASLSATLTVVFPTAPADGQIFGISSGLGITLLTNTSVKTIIGALSSIVAAGYASYIYDVTSDKWFRKG